MPHAIQEKTAPGTQLSLALNVQARRITEKIDELVHKEDWEALKSVIRVLDAHSRANELRAQGQSARAHLWLVGVGRKRQRQQLTKKSTPPLPAA